MDARIILIALTSQSLRKRKKTKTEKRTRISGMLRGVQFSPKIYGGVLFFCVLGLLHLGMTVGYNGVIYGIGLDYGTSGARVCVADNTRERNIIFSKSHPWEDSNGKIFNISCSRLTVQNWSMNYYIYELDIFSPFTLYTLPSTLCLYF